MADISTIKLGENTYNIKDKTAARKGMYVGTCSTAAATAAKVATTDPFPLDENDLPLVGTVIAIKFSNSNSYKTAGTTMTLNVNNTGAFPIYYNNAEVVSTTSANTAACGYKNRYIFYIFNGTLWVWLSYGNDSNSTYDDYSFGLGYGVQDNESESSTVTVTLVSYKLKAGPIGVKFIYNVPANSTMNINSVGAKGIYYRGAAITSGIIKAGDLATFIYNKGDSKYHLISIDRWQEDIDDLYSTKVNSSSLATVATSGSYNDLSDKPTIPSTDGLATETYVDTAVSGLVNSAPQTLDTLNELAGALGNDPNFATTVATQIGNKQDKPIDFDTWYTDTFGSGGLPTTEGTARTLSSSELSALNALTNDDSWEVSNIPAVLKINTQSLYADWSWTYRGTDQNAKYCYIINILPTRTGGKYWRRDTTIELAVTSSLATVATSGSYNDLSNKPTIPAEVIVDSNITQNGTNPVLGSAIHAALLNKMEHILLTMTNTNGVLAFLDDNQNLLTHSLVRLILNDPNKYVNIKYSEVVYEPFYFDFTEDLWMFKQNSMDNEYSISLSFDDEILLDEEYDSSLLSDYLDNYVPTTRKINNKALSSDITLTASDVSANTFIVNIIDGEDEDEYACDKTNAEIYAAWQAGRSVIATYDIYIYPLASGNITSTSAFFTGHLYDDPQSVDSWTIEVKNNSQFVHRTNTYLVDEDLPCASITNRNIGAWNNKSTRVIINMSYDSSNDTVSFTDANNSALTHTLVINLLNDSTNDVLIYYKYAFHRTYGLLDGYYYYSGIFEYGTYSYFSLYNNNGTLILDENTYFLVADESAVVPNGRKVNGKTLTSNIDTIIYGQKSSTGFRVGTYNSTTSTWTYAYSDTTLSVLTIYFDNSTGKAYTYNGKELKEFYSPNLSNFANINGDTDEDFYTRELSVNESNSAGSVNFSAEYDTNSEIVSLRLTDSEGESRVLPFNGTLNATATIMTDADFKTINNLSIIGSGDITISSGSPEAVVGVSVNNGDGNLIFTKANGNTVTADLNHTHSLYLTLHQSLTGYAKYVLCLDELEFISIANKDSSTLYLIPAT